MKKILFSAAAVCAAGLAMAASVESPNTFGVLKVSSTNAETVVSVPWEAVGSGNVKVKDFVMTTNMSDNDMLYLYDNTGETPTYKAWILSGGAWTGIATVKGVDGKTVTATADADATLARGQALIIWRQNYDGGTTPAESIYLYGQYNSTGVSSYTMTAGKATLFAPVNTTSLPFYLNKPEKSEIASGTTVACVKDWSNVNPGDTIRLQDKKGNAYTLSWDDEHDKWGYYTGADYITAAAIIQPGMGGWYMNTNTVRAVTFTTTTVDGEKE